MQLNFTRVGWLEGRGSWSGSSAVTGVTSNSPVGSVSCDGPALRVSGWRSSVAPGSDKLGISTAGVGVSAVRRR